MKLLTLPPTIEQVIWEFRTCEFSTLSKEGTPLTWPVMPLYQPEHSRFLITTAAGLSQKALNVRRNPHVALLFSNPTGSGLTNPPAVLVQGTAVAPDELVLTSAEMDAVSLHTMPRQPSDRAYSENWLAQWLFDWYYFRLCIYVTPQRILWWDSGDFSRAPKTMEIN
jgi:hypothetical protein